MPTQEEVNEFLNELRDSGVTNMFGAGVYVQEEYGVTRDEAREFVTTWMKSFR